MSDAEAVGWSAARLARALAFVPNEARCNQVLDALDDYVAAQLGGQEGEPEIALHLDACLECAQLYARLFDLEYAAQQESLPDAVAPPPPPFGWLREARGPSVQERLREAVVREAEQVRLLLTGELIRLLRPAPAPVLRGEGGRYQERIVHLDAADHPALQLPFSLTILGDRDAPNLTLVELRVRPPGRSWPDLDGMMVRVRVPGASWSGETDPWGIVSFPDVPRALLPELQFVVKLTPTR